MHNYFMEISVRVDTVFVVAVFLAYLITRVALQYASKVIERG